MTITISRDNLEAKRSTLAEDGFKLVGDSGTLSGDGCTIGYSYVEPTLTINIDSKPWWMTTGAIESHIQSFFV